MTDPVLHVLAGPNGAGKTTPYERVIGPSTHLPFISADQIAARRWPDQPGGGRDEGEQHQAIRGGGCCSGKGVSSDTKPLPTAGALLLTRSTLRSPLKII